MFKSLEVYKTLLKYKTFHNEYKILGNNRNIVFYIRFKSDGRRFYK